MKHTHTSLLALIVMMMTFAVPAMAGAPVQEPIFQIPPVRSATFDIIVEDFPDTISRGQTLTGSVTVVANGNPSQRFRVRLELLVETPLGDAPIQSGTFRINGNSRRTFNLSIPVSANARPGEHTLRFVVTVGGETLTAEHVIVVQ